MSFEFPKLGQGPTVFSNNPFSDYPYCVTRSESAWMALDESIVLEAFGREPAMLNVDYELNIAAMYESTAYDDAFATILGKAAAAAQAARQLFPTPCIVSLYGAPQAWNNLPITSQTARRVLTWLMGLGVFANSATTLYAAPAFYGDDSWSDEFWNTLVNARITCMEQLTQAAYEYVAHTGFQRSTDGISNNVPVFGVAYTPYVGSYNFVTAGPCSDATMTKQMLALRAASVKSCIFWNGSEFQLRNISNQTGPAREALVTFFKAQYANILARPGGAACSSILDDANATYSQLLEAFAVPQDNYISRFVGLLFLGKTS